MLAMQRRNGIMSASRLQVLRRFIPQITPGYTGSRDNGI
jgi:hypothetical protein